MKKLSLILIFMMLLLITMSISIFAADDTNIAPNANLTTDSKHWHVVGNDSWAKNCIPYLVDGDYATGIPSTCQLAWDNHHFKFDEPVQIGMVILHVNGSGVRGNIDQVNNVNINTEYYVVLYDKNGKEVSFTSQKAGNKTELVFEYPNPMEVTYVKIAYFANYSTESAYLREVEIFPHFCLYDELVETIKKPTCIEPGEGKFACDCGKTEIREIIPTGIHEYTDLESFVYSNGFLDKGEIIRGCPTCDDFIEEEKAPPFKFLGYSVSRNARSICAGYSVNKEIIKDYNEANNVTLDYGIICAVSDSVNPLSLSGEVAENINGQASSLSDTNYPRFDIKISANDWTNIANTPLVMCAYIIDGDKLTYICSETNTETATPICYNQLNIQPI